MCICTPTVGNQYLLYMRKIRIIVAGLLLLTCMGVYAKAPKDTVRILAIGNSFSQDAVEQNLHELAAADGIVAIIGNAYIGGCSLERHVNNSRTDAPAYAYRKIPADGIRTERKGARLSEILADEQWDYVSFQQASPLSGQFSTYEEFLPELYGYVKARVPEDVKFMMHQTWAYSQDSGHSGFKNYGKDQMTMYKAIVDAYDRAARLVGIKIIIPSGTAIQNARTSFIGDNMDRDGYHLDLLWGRYTAACAWYEKIFGNVLRNSYAPQGLTEDSVEVCRLSAREAVKHPDEVTRIDVAELPVLYRDASLPVETRVQDLMSRMTLREKIAQINQYTLGRNDNVNNLDEVVTKVPGEVGSLIYFGDDASLRNAMQKKAVEGTRLGIPILFGFDVIHGFRTVYPIPLAIGASWNPELAGEVSRVAAQEAYDAGINWTFSPMVDIARDARWGRIAEGYGEDPYLTSVFSAATVKAYQGGDLSEPYNIAACLKHYVGYGASEAGRDYVPTEISRQTLWDTYLPPFEAGVRAGAATLMSSFNNISGIPGSANHYTMTEILKEKWGHDGFVVADWNAIVQLVNQGLAKDGKEAAMYAINAGLDMDMVDNLYMQHLEALVAEGKVSLSRVDDAVRRVLALKFELGLFEKPYTDEKPENERILLPESLDAAQRMAAESMVLLKNDSGVLPLAKDLKIALVGPMAKNQADLLGSWYGRGRAEDVTSIFDGLSAVMDSTVMYAEGCAFDGTDTTGFAKAVETASGADVVVLCLGEKRTWSGENASRSTIALPEIQEQLLTAVKRAGKPVVVLLSNGRSLDLTRIAPAADAVLEMWQPGVMAGPAVAGILTGEYNPSGRLNVTFPYTTGQIPVYYNHRESGRRGSQGLYQDIPSTPMYEFGYGLSYTDYEYGDLKVSSDTISAGDKVTATVTVRNAGEMDGKETVQWYVCDPYSSITRPVKELKHFEKRLLRSGEEHVFTFEIDPVHDLSFVDSEGNRFVEPGDFYIIVKDMKAKITLVE